MPNAWPIFTLSVFSSRTSALAKPQPLNRPRKVSTTAVIATKP